MASKIGITHAGRNANITLTVPAAKLADVLIAIGKALGGRSTDTIVHKSNARSRRNQRRKSLQKDNHEVPKGACEPAVITSGKTTRKVAASPMASVVKQPCVPAQKPCKVAEGTSEKKPIRLEKVVLKERFEPIQRLEKSVETDTVAASNQRVPQARTKTPSRIPREPKVVDTFLTTLASIRADNFGTIVGEDFELFSRPSHLPGVPVDDIKRLLSLKLHCHNGPSYVPKWMWEKDPAKAKIMQDSINMGNLARKFRVALEKSLKERDQFKISRSH